MGRSTHPLTYATVVAYFCDTGISLGVPTADDRTISYADLRDRYRDIAKTLGFEGHIAWAWAMP